MVINIIAIVFFEIPFPVFQNKISSYSIGLLLDTVGCFLYRSGPRGMDFRIFLEWLLEL